MEAYRFYQTAGKVSWMLMGNLQRATDQIYSLQSVFGTDYHQDVEVASSISLAFSWGLLA